MIKKLLLFPGSFAPITKGHFNFLSKSIEKLANIENINRNEILGIISPVSSNYNKKSVKQVTAQNRIDLINIGIRNYNLNNKYNIVLDSWEIEQSEWKETILVKNHLIEKYSLNPNMLFGSDIITGMATDIDNGSLIWNNINELLDKSTVFTFVRKEDMKSLNESFNKIKTERNVDCNFICLESCIKYQNISSSLIRKLINSDSDYDLSEYIFPEQAEYIKKHNLWNQNN